MIWDNYIGTEFLVPESVCENIINYAENKIEKGFFNKSQSKFRNDVGVSLSRMSSYKNSENFIIINKTIKYSLNKFLSNFTINQSEKNYSYTEHKFQKTVENEGFHIWHFENGGEQNNRAFVWMLYLNTIEKGGQTEFYKSKNEIIRIKPEIGKFVFWPAGETHTHRAAPDLQETKYVLTGWVNRL
jgi:hypothetical protein